MEPHSGSLRWRLSAQSETTARAFNLYGTALLTSCSLRRLQELAWQQNRTPLPRNASDEGVETREQLVRVPISRASREYFSQNSGRGQALPRVTSAVCGEPPSRMNVTETVVPGA